MLADAPLPTVVWADLHRQVHGIPELFCDGGAYDLHWLTELCAAAGAAAAFKLADIKGLLSTAGASEDRYIEHLANATCPHRAAADARRMAEAVLASL
jgi:hypothetical protein